MDSQRDQTNPSMFLMLSRLPVLQPDFEGKQVEEYVQFKIWETQRSSGGTAWYGVGASVGCRHWLERAAFFRTPIGSLRQMNVSRL